jgi:two-component system cell cycle response regulator
MVVEGSDYRIPFPWDRGACYLIEERKADLAYRMFALLRETRHLQGLVVTRQYPDRIREEQPLDDARIIWLSHTPGNDHQNPTALGTLAKTIAKFIEDAQGNAVVLIDGIEFLAVNNGFLQTLMFVEHVNEFVMQKQAVVLLPVNPEALEEKEVALLERNVEVVPADALRTDLEREEVAKLLDAY